MVWMSRTLKIALVGLLAVDAAWSAQSIVGGSAIPDAVRSARQAGDLVRVADAAAPATSEGTGELDGLWYSDGYGLGMIFEKGQGIATNANKMGHKAGEVILKLSPSGKDQYRGEMYFDVVRDKFEWQPAKAAIMNKELRIGLPNGRQVLMAKKAPPGPSESFPSGSRFMIGSCAPGTFVIVTESPALDLMKLPVTGKYKFAEAPPPLNTILAEAEQFASATCGANAIRTGYPIFFQLQELPLPPFAISDFDKADARVRVYVGTADWTNNMLWAATEKKKEADRVAAQKATANAGAARAEKSKRDRAAFAAKYGAVELDKMAPLYTNPFALEGKAILVRGSFTSMEDRSTALFSALAYGLSDRAGEIVVADVPTTAFTDQADTLLAVRVMGQKKLEQSSGGKAPLVKYLGHIKCPPSNDPFPSCP